MTRYQSPRIIRRINPGRSRPGASACSIERVSTGAQINPPFLRVSACASHRMAAPPFDPPATGERASLEEFEAAMDELAEGMDDVPVLTPEALTRESIDGHR